MENLYQEFMKNPEFLKNAMNMLQNNPQMMDQISNVSNMLSKNPEMLNSFMNLNSNSNNSKNNTNDNQPTYEIDTEIKLLNLKNRDYNNLIGKIIRFDNLKNRYEVNIPSLDKNILVKEENIENVNNDNTDNIEIPIEID